MAAARRFVIDHDLATMPADDSLVVIETPAYLRHLIPFAAYYDPPRFDPRPDRHLHRHASDDAGDDARTLLRLDQQHIGPRGVPGPSPAARVRPHQSEPGAECISTAAEFTEGWAFYCERTMKEKGFDDTPKHRYIQHTDAIWRATRIVLDVKLHRGEIGFDDAVEFLIAQTGFERPAALAEVKRYTSTPSYQLSYLFGRHLIDRLKADVQRAQGAGFSLKGFHDTLIYGGNMPASYARRLFPALSM